jgi:hypothetical protein
MSAKFVYGSVMIDSPASGRAVVMNFQFGEVASAAK